MHHHHHHSSGRENLYFQGLVTCFCMKPFAGRPMIECNECHTWIHLSCAKIRKSNVPEVFVCQKCRDSK
uniref:PHD finger protein 13 n=1 Tax=Homo sapiens TaxID=9606 RepID=UPI0001E3061C|nr:Chain A, PHD finger protein 13 [Homo sapiens]